MPTSSWVKPEARTWTLCGKWALQVTGFFLVFILFLLSACQLLLPTAPSILLPSQKHLVCNKETSS